MKLTVCDSIMGSGKTQAAINRMNTDTEHNYIFITPYLNEVYRIKEDCSERKFAEPLQKGDGKLDNMHNLIGERRNIASTHALFKTYTDYTLELIRNGDYKLILDEVFDVVEWIHVSKKDVQILLESNQLTIAEDGRVSWVDDTYAGKFSELKAIADTGHLILYKDYFLYWVFPVEVFAAFKEVIILTYQFDAQVQKYYYDLNGVEFDKIYTKRVSDNEYEFSDSPHPEPYVSRLKDRVHILEDEKLNAIGFDDNALSASWYNREKVKRVKFLMQTLKKNLYNLFFHKFTCPVGDRMWTTFKDAKQYLTGKGYTNSFVSYNLRASNNYKGRTHIAYCVNVYFNPFLKNYFLEQGVEVREDAYALSEMVQFLWRSAIREGKDIWVYIPSSRMRRILTNWLENLKGENENEQRKN